MNLPDEKYAIAEASRQLSEWLEIPDARSRVDGKVTGWDASIRAGEFVFLVEYRKRGNPVSIAGFLRRATELGRQNALLVVPYMPPAGREACRSAGVSWLDLSGNARIVVPGLRIMVEGKRNRFSQRGRPRNAFAPKSSRVARWLLMYPNERFLQKELAANIDLDEGTTSRVVRRLEAEGLIARDPSGRVRAASPDRLLDAWRHSYRFESHHVIKGHVQARSGEERLRKVAAAFEAAGQEHAATGLSAAWLYSGFAGFRLVSVYVARPPAPSFLEEIGFHESATGSNLWLVLPNEEGVWTGAAVEQGVRTVHPIQAYLDLPSHPERSQEAADQLRAQWLAWNEND